MNDIPKVQGLLQLIIFLFPNDLVDGEINGENACQSIQNYDNSVKLLLYNNHVCNFNNINALFKAFRCSTYDSFFFKNW